MKKLLLFSLFILTSSCQPSSLEEFQIEGQASARRLLQDLRKIETRSDLAIVEPLLKKDFFAISELAIEALTFQMKNPGEECGFTTAQAFLNEALLEEFRRVYALEGGRECIERAAKEAMLRLDAKEKQYSSLKK